MKVFVAGATGAVGRRAVAALVGAGHEVTGVARTEEKAALLRSLGAVPAETDLFDAARLKDAVAGHDVVVNLATHIPRARDAIRLKAWNENDRIRREASRNLVDAALAVGAERYVQESIAFLYEGAGAEWLDEDSPKTDNPLFAGTFEAEQQARRFTEAGGAGGVGVVLRFGMFYDAESHTTQDMVRTAALTGFLPLPGSADSYFTFIATDDAGSGVAAALTAPAGTYNVVEDDPATRSEIADALGRGLGRRVRLTPAVAASVGGKKSHYLGTSIRVSGRRFREATGWRPAVASVRDGLPVVAKQVMASNRAEVSPG